MENGVPFYYDYKNEVVSQYSPSTVHCQNVGLTRYFQKYLLQKAMSVFEWHMPREWAQNYILYCLYCWGAVAVVNTDKFGVIAQSCGLTGYDVYYQPTHAIITNPRISQTLRPRIGMQCTILRLQPNYSGIMDIVTYYADLLALCAESIGMNLVNSKLSYVFMSDGKQAAESYKKAVDKIYSGDVSVFIDKQLFNEDGSPRWLMFNQDVGKNYIADRVLLDMRKIEQMFATDIGIPNANTDKKERLITDEVNSNNFETQSRCDMWLQELQKSCAETRDMFDIDLSVDWRNIERGATLGTNGNTVNTGVVSV